MRKKIFLGFFILLSSCFTYKKEGHSAKTRLNEKFSIFIKEIKNDLYIVKNQYIYYENNYLYFEVDSFYKKNKSSFFFVHLNNDEIKHLYQMLKNIKFNIKNEKNCNVKFNLFMFYSLKDTSISFHRIFTSKLSREYQSFFNHIHNLLKEKKLKNIIYNKIDLELKSYINIISDKGNIVTLSMYSSFLLWKKITSDSSYFTKGNQNDLHKYLFRIPINQNNEVMCIFYKPNENVILYKDGKIEKQVFVGRNLNKIDNFLITIYQNQKKIDSVNLFGVVHNKQFEQSNILSLNKK